MLLKELCKSKVWSGCVVKDKFKQFISLSYFPVPIVPFHDTTETTKVHGYTIPKRTLVVISQYSINMDSNHWPEPHTFLPDRWLDADGKYVKNDKFLGFGIGNFYQTLPVLKNIFTQYYRFRPIGL